MIIRVLIVLTMVGCASAPPYARCGGDVSCAMGHCADISLTRSDGTTADASFCTSDCASDADCPDEGRCIALAHDPTRAFFCVKRCTVTSECTTPLVCTMVTSGSATFGACLP